MSRIFISHSSVDNAKALAIGQWLDARGWTDYFLDLHADRGIAPGERWLQAFLSAVSRCEAVIFLLTPAWCKSHYCTTEVAQAKAQGKRLFGVMIEKVDWAELPVAVTGEWQLCDLTGADDPVHFRVGRPPIVTTDTPVSFSRAGLEDLGRGLRKAGLDVSSFPWPPQDDPQREPYRGLDPLEEADAGIFFGRDADLVIAIDRIRLLRERRRERLFVVLGASGAGKSSFLRAGLLPRLRNDSEHMCVLPVIRPETAVIEGKFGLLSSLQTALASFGVPASRDALRRELLTDDNTGLRAAVGRLAAATAGPEPRPGKALPTVVFPIDQAEELFGSEGSAEAARFLRMLQDVGHPAPGDVPVLVIFTIRSDSWASLQAEPALLALPTELFSLSPMPASEFKSVIEGPARRQSENTEPLIIDARLSAQLVEEASGADALPLLALTLQLLYREFRAADGKRLRLGLEEYASLGGLQQVINVAAARAFAKPTDAPTIPADPAKCEGYLREAFAQLATVDERTREARRRQALRADLRRRGPEVDAIVQRLIDHRLLRSDIRAGGDGGSQEVVEVAHEALLRRWGLLSRWVDEHADRLRTIEIVHRAAEEWATADCAETLLVHRGDRLERAEALLTDASLAARIDQRMRDYLQACRKAVAKEQSDREQRQQEVTWAQQRTARTQRRLAWVLSLAGMLTVALGVWIDYQARDVRAQTALGLAEAAERALADGYIDRAVRLGVMAARPSWLDDVPSAARAVLVRAADHLNSQTILATGRLSVDPSFSPDRRRVLTGTHDGTARVWDAESGKPVGHAMKHEDAVRSARFSPDGKRVLTGSADGTARLWDAESGNPMGQTMAHEDVVRSAVFSPNGEHVLTASDDGTARLWHAESGKPLGHAMKHEGPVRSAAFSGEGKRVLTWSDDRTARLWDAKSSKPLGQAMRHEGAVGAAVFSPDGKRVLTSSADGPRMWDAESGKPLGQVMKHERTVWAAGFSPDGTRVLTVSADSTARLWDVESGKPLSQVMKHERAILTLFSPDGKYVLTGSYDGTALVWDAETGKPLGQVMKHEGVIRSAVFSPDGRRVMTGSSDGTARIWDAGNGKPLGQAMKHEGAVRSAVFSPDGRRVLTGSADSTSRLWDTEVSKPVGQAMKHGGAVRSAQFSPDGKRVLTVSDDGTARVWEVESGKPLRDALKHEGTTGSAVFGPDGKHVLTWSDSGAVRLWGAEGGGRPLGQALKHEGVVRFAIFSPDGKSVLIVSDDGTARVWEVESGKPLGQAMKHKDVIRSALFSPDGKRLLTGSDDGTAAIWNAESGKPLGQLMKHGRAVWTTLFSANGKRVLTASYDGTTRVWDAENGNPLGHPMKHEGGVMSVASSPDGKRVLTGSADGTARVWDAESGKPLGQAMRHEGTVQSALFSPDGKRVITGSTDRTARQWDAESGKPLGRAMKHEAAIKSMLFTSNGKSVLIVSDDGTARVWEVESGKPLGQAMQHEDVIRSALFSPDGKRVLTGSADGTARVWNVEWEALAHSPRDAIARVCLTAKAGTLHIRAADLESTMLLRPERVGTSVCE